MKYISFLYIVVIFALIGCRNENEYLEYQEPINEKYLREYVEIYNESGINHYWVGRYVMLDYDFFIGIETPIENRFAMVFAKDNDKCNSFEYDAIVMYLPNSQDSISYYYKNNLIKIQSYIEQSSYFNQNCKFKNKVNVQDCGRTVRPGIYRFPPNQARCTPHSAGASGSETSASLSGL